MFGLEGIIERILRESQDTAMTVMDIQSAVRRQHNKLVLSPVIMAKLAMMHKKKIIILRVDWLWPRHSFVEINL